MARTLTQMRFEVNARVEGKAVPYNVLVQLIQEGDRVYLDVQQANELSNARIPIAPATREE